MKVKDGMRYYTCQYCKKDVCSLASHLYDNLCCSNPKCGFESQKDEREERLKNGSD